MEELEKNETSTQPEENTVSLASAQALADALAKIEAYTPTTWVDNSSPDIDAEHLNKPEQAIKRVTDALNSAVDVIKDLQSQVTKNAGAISDVNNNLSNGSVKSYFSPHKNNEADLCKGYNNSDGVFYFNYQGALVPIKKYVFSDGQGNGIFSSDQLVKNSDLPKNFKFLNLKYNTASSYDTEVLKYIESLKESVFIIYCQHGSASMYMGFIVGDGKYGTVLRFEYDSLYVNGCSGNAWAGWTKLG